MAALLKQAARRIGPAGFIRQLLAAFEPERAVTQPQPIPAQPAAAGREIFPLVEPLSERELEVLALVAEGLTNGEIAQKLYIAVGTVKRHLTNINQKLGSSNRTQAVTIARELYLLT